eukprot:403354021
MKKFNLSKILILTIKQTEKVKRSSNYYKDQMSQQPSHKFRQQKYQKLRQLSIKKYNRIIRLNRSKLTLEKAPLIDNQKQKSLKLSNIKYLNASVTKTYYLLMLHNFMTNLQQVKDQKYNRKDLQMSNQNQNEIIFSQKIQNDIKNGEKVQVQDTLLKSHKQMSPVKQQNLNQSSIFCMTLEAQIIMEKGANSIYVLNQIEDNDLKYEKFTPSKLLQQTKDLEELKSTQKYLDYQDVCSINRLDTQHRQFQSNVQFKKSSTYGLGNKYQSDKHNESINESKLTAVEQIRDIYEEQNNYYCDLISDDEDSEISSPSENREKLHEMSRDTQNNDGPTFINMDTKMKFKAKNLQQILDSQQVVVSGRTTKFKIKDKNQPVITISHDKIKSEIISEFNSIRHSKKISPVKIEKNIYKIHQRQSINKSDCSSILNESTNIKEVMQNRSNAQKQFLNNLSPSSKDLTLVAINNETLPSYQTLTLSSPQSNKITSLIELNLRLANLKELTETLFIQNLFIRSVDVRNNRLVKIPDSICDLPHLWKIRMDYNYITELPINIGLISKLEYLSASQNKIQKLPSSITEYGVKLNVLHLNDNKLYDLPLNIGNLSDLKSFLLHNNNLPKIPQTIHKLSKLNEFSLDWFIYHYRDRLIPKIQKEETGRIFIQEFLKLIQLYEKVNEGKKDQQVSFVHYFMFFHKLQKASEIQEILFQKKRTIFHLLALNGSLFLFHELYELLKNICKIDLNQLDEEDSTPLLLAIKNKRKDFIKHLLTLQVININRGSFKYGYPLHLLIQTQNFKLTLRLILSDQEDNYKYLDINAKNEDGNNAMHFLFMNFSTNPQQARKIAAQLIKRGININSLNKSELSPLQVAILGSQMEAVQFAIDHNNLMRRSMRSPDFKISFNRQLFDFNLKGGKNSQNSLHLAVALNNMKLIVQIVSSDEIIRHFDIDDEGRMAKDICAYNSPIYKLLVKYENKLHQNTFQLQLHEKEQHDHIDIQQQYYNLRTQKQPKRIQKKLMHQKSMPAFQSVPRTLLNNTKSHQNLHHFDQQNFYSQSNQGNSILKADRNTRYSHLKLDDVVLRKSHQRVLSGDHGLYQTQMQNIFSTNELSSDGVDEFSNQEFQTTKVKLSVKQLENNLQRNILVKTQKKYFEDAITKDQQIQSFKQKLKKQISSEEDKNKIQLRNEISSPEDSYMMNPTVQAASPHKDLSENIRGEFILQRPFKMGLNDNIRHTIQKMNCGSFARQSDEPVKTEIINNEQTFEDDDANIPEEENEQSNSNQIESKSPIKILNRHQTPSGVEIEIESSYKQQAYVKKIIEEMIRCQNIGNQATEIQQRSITQQSNSNRATKMSFNANMIHPCILVTANQEQGNLNHDQSSMFIAADDCCGIPAPMEEQFSPKIPQAQKEFNNLKTKLTQEIFKENQRAKYSQSEIESRAKMNYQTIIQAIIRKDQKVKQLIIENYQNLNTINSSEITLFIDSIYYFCQVFSLQEILEILQLSFKQKSQELYSQKNITIQLSNLIVFELINTHQIRIYDQKQQLQHQIKLLDRQKLVVIEDFQSPNMIQKLKHMTKSPSVQILKFKSPLLNFRESIEDNDQMPKESPMRKMRMKDYNSNQIIVQISPEARVDTYNSSVSKGNMLSSRMQQNSGKIVYSDLKQSLKGHRSILSSKLAQPFTQPNRRLSPREQFKFSTEIDRQSIDETVLSESIPQSSPRGAQMFVYGFNQDSDSYNSSSDERKIYSSIQQKHDQLLLESARNFNNSQPNKNVLPNQNKLSGKLLVQSLEHQQNKLKEKLFIKTHNLQSTISKYNLSKHIQATTMIMQNNEGTPQIKNKGKMFQLLDTQHKQNKLNQQSYEYKEKRDSQSTDEYLIQSTFQNPRSINFNEQISKDDPEFNYIQINNRNLAQDFGRNKLYNSENQYSKKFSKLNQQPNPLNAQNSKKKDKRLEFQTSTSNLNKNQSRQQFSGITSVEKNSEIQSRKYSKDSNSSKMLGISRSTAQMKSNFEQKATLTQKIPESTPIYGIQKAHSKPSLLSSTFSNKNLRQIMTQQPLYKNSRQSTEKHKVQPSSSHLQKSTNVHTYYQQQSLPIKNNNFKEQNKVLDIKQQVNNLIMSPSQKHITSGVMMLNSHLHSQSQRELIFTSRSESQNNFINSTQSNTSHSAQKQNYPIRGFKNSGSLQSQNNNSNNTQKKHIQGKETTKAKTDRMIF